MVTNSNSGSSLLVVVFALSAVFFLGTLWLYFTTSQSSISTNNPPATVVSPITASAKNPVAVSLTQQTAISGTASGPQVIDVNLTAANQKISGLQISLTANYSGDSPPIEVTGNLAGLVFITKTADLDSNSHTVTIALAGYSLGGVVLNGTSSVSTLKVTGGQLTNFVLDPKLTKIVDFATAENLPVDTSKINIASH